MHCPCSSNGVLTGNDAVEMKNEYLDNLKVDAHAWRGLYICRICGAFWEESFTEDRFGGEPILRRISENDVKERWGI